MFHLHNDTEGLIYFEDKNRVCPYDHRLIGYAMQDSDIVRVFYSQQEMKKFYDYNYFDCNFRGKKLEPIFFWSQKRWDSRKQNVKAIENHGK